jgi:hypothetical protein
MKMDSIRFMIDSACAGRRPVIFGAASPLLSCCLTEIFRAGLTPNRQTLYAARSQAALLDFVPALGDICQQPRSGHSSLRFLVTVTARFEVLYVFVIIEVGTRRIVHFNATAHPTADWTVQQFRRSSRETSVPVPHSRPRSYFFLRARRHSEIHEPGHLENAVPGFPSECLLRTISRQRLSRMFGFSDSVG